MHNMAETEKVEVYHLVARKVIIWLQHLIQFFSFLYIIQLYCYVRQCWLMCTILLGVVEGYGTMYIIIYIGCTVIHNTHFWAP